MRSSESKPPPLQGRIIARPKRVNYFLRLLMLPGFFVFPTRWQYCSSEMGQLLLTFADVAGFFFFFKSTRATHPLRKIRYEAFKAALARSFQREFGRTRSVSRVGYSHVTTRDFWLCTCIRARDCRRRRRFFCFSISICPGSPASLRALSPGSRAHAFGPGRRCV